MKKNVDRRRRVVLVALLTLLCCDVVRPQHQQQAGGAFEEDEYFRNLQNSGTKGVVDGARMEGRLGEVGERGRKWVPLAVGALGGFAMDYIWSGWTIRKVERQHSKTLKTYQTSWEKESIEVKDLLELQLDSYHKRLSLMEETIVQLKQSALDAGVDVNATQDELDYEDFTQPDTNKDNIISKKEFDDYIEHYLEAYPSVKREDMPQFEDFDSNGDGVVTFPEWKAYLKELRGNCTHCQKNQENDTSTKLSDEVSSGKKISDMYDNVKKKKKSNKSENQRSDRKKGKS